MSEPTPHSNPESAMTDESAQRTETDQFTEDDIIFDCPFCNKSMAIDKRGPV